MNTWCNVKKIAMHMLMVACALGTVFSPIVSAADQSCVDLLAAERSSGKKILVDKNGWTELHHLVGSSPLSFVEYCAVEECLKRHPRLKFIKTMSGDAPLHLFIDTQYSFGFIDNRDYQSNIVKIIDAFVSTKYEVKPGQKVRSGINIKNGNDETALHLAAGYGLDYIITLLLQHGADKEAITVAKNTPLDFAVGRGHLSSVRLLLDSGARCSEKTIVRAHHQLGRAVRKGDQEGIVIYTNILEELRKHPVA
jgi:hypothetical protein